MAGSHPSLRSFNASGYFTGWESADGERSTALTWDDGLPDTYTASDGTVTTFNYTDDVLTSIDIGSRTLTLAYTDGDLTSITDIDGSVREFEYDAGHRLIGESIAGTAYAHGWEYTDGLLTGETFGAGDEAVTWQISSASGAGLDEPALGNAWSHITDPNGNVTSRLFDADGNLFRQVNPDGGIESFEYEDGWLVGYTDALGRATEYDRDALGYVTEITYADATSESFVYQNDFHALTDHTDERGAVTHYEYDEDGHVIAITDAYGTADAVTTSYVWEDGRLIEVRDDADALLHAYEYDGYGRKISDTDGEDNEQTWTYDSNGNVATWTDGRGITTSYTNDAKGRVLSVTIDSTTRSFVYDDAGNLTRAIDVNGTFFDTEFDSRGNAVRSIAGSNTASAIITRNVFDDADRLIGAYDANGNYTSFEYDAAGRLVSTTDALDNSDLIVYNAAGEMTAYRDVLGNWTEYTLDALGRVEVVTDELGNETTFGYDDGGLVTVVEDALGDETLYAYNARGQLAASEDADGVGFVYAYDANGLLLSVTDSLGRVTTYGRDALGRVTSVTEADGTASERTTTLTLDENGNVIATTDALSRTTTVEFDDFDRPIETTDEAGNVWAWTYDANGAVLTETYNGKTTTHEYDALGRRVLTTDADGRETQFEYGNDGRLSRVVDGEGNATEYLYDALGRLVLTIAADGGTTEQRYDAAGNLLALIDPVGNVTSWLYDRTYRVVAEIDPLGETESVSYDLVGRPLIVTDRLGRQKVYTYTDGGRIASEAWYDDEENLIDTLTYTYNDDGRLYTATNDAGTYTFTYDALGRVATVQDINGITLTYGWDEVDDLVTLSDSEGGVITSEYDEAHRLIERSQSGTGVESISIQIDYDTEGRRGELRRYSDATGTTLISSTEYGYDNAGNLTSLIHKDDVGDPLVTYSNTFDDNNRITSETRNSVTVNYEYDEVNQVVDDDTNEYEYDLNGNRTMTGYTTGTGNRIETDGTWTYEYDLEGNLIKKSMGEEDETWEYGYDNTNRLLWAEKALTDGGVVRLRVEYVYDVFGNRVAQTVDTFDAEGDPLDSETSRYAFIGQQVWADLDENGDIVTRYLLGDNFGERFARSGDGDTFWLLTDRLGSTREILDETGDLVDEITYDAFGNITSETDPGLGGDYLYTGLRWFAATRLYGTPNRDYAPTIAKWLQVDPIGFNGGLMNLYGYVGNNGTNLTDLSGLDYEWDSKSEHLGKSSKELSTLIKDKVLEDKIILASKKDEAGNELRLRYSAERGQFYGELMLPNANKTIEIAKCIPEHAINFPIWNIGTVKGSEKKQLIEITWYNIGTESGEQNGKNAIILQLIFKEVMFALKNYEDQVKFLHGWFSGSDDRLKDAQRDYVEECYTTKDQRDEIAKLVKGKKEGTVSLNARVFVFDVVNQKRKVLQLTVMTTKEAGVKIMWVETKEKE